MRKTRVLSALAAAAAGAVLAIAPPATAGTATTTALGATPNPSVAGQSITLTAVVTGATPTGQVAFADSGAPLGTVDLTAGAATLVVSGLSAGSHALTASYAGDADDDPSAATLTQVVTPAPPPPATVKPPKVRLAVSATKAAVGDKVQLRWRSKRADSLTASGDWSGSQKAKGTATVRLSERGKHVFKLTVANAAGAKTASVTVVAARKAKTFDLVVTDELTMVGSKVEVTADGLAKAEEYTIRLAGKPVVTGKANGTGDVSRDFELAKTTPEGALPLTITGSNPTRKGAAVLHVIKPKTFVVQVASHEVKRNKEQTLTVKGLAPDESVTVTYAGKKLTVGMGDSHGTFVVVFVVGPDPGDKTVKVVGADPSRHGEATFTVTANNDGGGGGDDGGGDQGPPQQL